MLPARCLHQSRMVHPRVERLGRLVPALAQALVKASVLALALASALALAQVMEVAVVGVPP